MPDRRKRQGQGLERERRVVHRGSATGLGFSEEERRGDPRRKSEIVMERMDNRNAAVRRAGQAADQRRRENIRKIAETPTRPARAIRRGATNVANLLGSQISHADVERKRKKLREERAQQRR